MNIAQLLARAARTFPERPALHRGARALCDYRMLAHRVACMARALRETAALAPGDRVALLMGNAPEYIEALYAIFWAGLTAVPINAKLHPAEALYILNDAEASALFASRDLAGPIGGVLGQAPAVRHVFVPGERSYAALAGSAPIAAAEARPEDLAWLFYTSGTTGRPKGVMETHHILYAMAACYFTDVDDIAPDEAMVYAAPVSHGAGMYGFPAMLRGARHVIPEAGSFDVAEIASLARSMGKVSLFAAPTMVKRLVDHVAASGSGGAGFKTIAYGGGPMYLADIKQALDVMGDRFVQIYGQGESPMCITALGREHLAARDHPRWEARIGSVGVAQSMVEVRVADPDGRALPPGEIGDVLVRGETVMPGYWRRPEASAETLRGGWLWTGDVGAFDDDGFLTLKDRSKDVIISGAANIYPREVEEVILRHAAVAETAVVGRKHPEWGEEVVAFVVRRGGQAVEPADLDRLCLDHIARFKRPREYKFVESLPKNNYGKILKTALRELL